MWVITFNRLNNALTPLLYNFNIIIDFGLLRRNRMVLEHNLNTYKILPHQLFADRIYN